MLKLAGYSLIFNTENKIMDDYQKCIVTLFNLRDLNIPISPQSTTALVSSNCFYKFLKNIENKGYLEAGLSPYSLNKNMPTVWGGQLTKIGNKWLTNEYLAYVDFLQFKKKAMGYNAFERFGFIAQGEYDWIPDKFYAIPLP
jgi:hypothetical protein